MAPARKRRASKGRKKSAKSTRSKAASKKTKKGASAGSRKKSARTRAGTAGRKSSARKGAARKARRKAQHPAEPREVLGEGNYTASREFREGQTSFVRRNRNRIGKMGQDAEAALEGPEGTELEQAEDSARARSHSPGEER